MITSTNDGQPKGTSRPPEADLLYDGRGGHSLDRGLGEGGLGDGLCHNHRLGGRGVWLGHHSTAARPAI